MDVTTLLLGGAALFLLYTNKESRDNLLKKQQELASDFAYYKQQQKVDEQIRQEQEALEKAKSKLSNYISLVGFCGMIGNYRVSDALISAAWYIKLHNSSNQRITVVFQSASVTLFGYRQQKGNEILKTKNITIEPYSDSDWINISYFEDSQLFGHNTVGRYLYDNYDEYQNICYYNDKASIYLKFQLTNPYVNSGMAEDCEVKDLVGSILTMPVWAIISARRNDIISHEENLIYNRHYAQTEVDKFKDLNSLSDIASDVSSLVQKI